MSAAKNLSNPADVRCAIHPDSTLVCPICNAAKGGEAQKALHGHLLSKWGKLGKGKKHKFAPRPNRRKTTE